MAAARAQLARAARLELMAARRDGALDVTFHPLDYDHAGAVRAMAARGLPAEYARALATAR